MPAMRRPSRWILSRAVIREMVPTLVMAAGVTTFILLVRSLFTLADLFISYNVAAGTAVRLLLYAVPNVLALTIPVGVLFAVMMTAARWSADSEVIALQASGVSLARIARPMVFAGVLIFLFSSWLTISLMPRANNAFQRLTMEVRLSGARSAVEARVFNEDFPGRLLYVDNVDVESRRWFGILLFDQTSPQEERLVVAESGQMFEDSRDRSMWLELEDTVTHVIRRHQPEVYQQNANRELRVQVGTATEVGGTRRLGVRVTETPELLRRLRSGTLSPEEVRQTAVEVHKRIVIPAAILVFTLLGLPLGIRNRRGGKGFGFIASLGIVMLYYVLLNNGELIALSGKAPAAISMWLPNAVLLVAGVLGLWRANQGFSASPGLLSRWWQAFRERFAARVSASREVPETSGEITISGRFRRRRAGSGNGSGSTNIIIGILDRYLVRTCFLYFVMVVVAVCTIYVAVNLSENLDDIQRNRVPWLPVVSFYFFSLPQILHDLLPIAFLVAFLATAAVLEKNNESTALKAAGISLTRVGTPLLGLGLLLAGGLFFMDESIVQRANRAAQQLEDMIKGRKVARSYRSTDRPWLFLPDGRTLVNFLQFDGDALTLVRPSVYTFNEDLQLRSRMVADRAAFREDGWVAEGGWTRTFFEDSSPTFLAHTEPVIMPLGVGPEYFGREYRRPSQMSLGELRSYITTLQAAGYGVDPLRVQLHQKVAYPLSIVLLAWLALPFAFRMGRKGTVVGVAVALVLGMAYFALTAVVVKLGEASLIPPLLAAWTPNAIFLFLAINRHTTLKT